MKSALIAAALIAGLAACETGEVDDDVDATGMAVDTIVTEQTYQDTALVTTDTMIEVDTMDAGDEGMVGRDTVVNTTP